MTQERSVVLVGIRLRSRNRGNGGRREGDGINGITVCRASVREWNNYPRNPPEELGYRSTPFDRAQNAVAGNVRRSRCSREGNCLARCAITAN